MGDAGGKREAANKPDQGEGYRATRGRAARGDRAGWPAERRRRGDWEEFKGRGDPRAQGEVGAARGDRGGGPVERQEKEEKTRRTPGAQSMRRPANLRAGKARGTRTPSRTTGNAASRRR